MYDTVPSIVAKVASSARPGGSESLQLIAPALANIVLTS